MKIEEMPAGREMDALVAEKVMGLTVVPDLISGSGFRATDMSRPSAFQPELEPPMPLFEANPIKPYSTDIAAAWEVVEKIRLNATLDHIEERHEAEGVWVVQFCAKTSNEPWWHEHAYGDTVPLAICRAALLAVGVKDAPSP